MMKVFQFRLAVLFVLMAVPLMGAAVLASKPPQKSRTMVQASPDPEGLTTPCNGMLGSGIDAYYSKNSGKIFVDYTYGCQAGGGLLGGCYVTKTEALMRYGTEVGYSTLQYNPWCNTETTYSGWAGLQPGVFGPGAYTYTIQLFSSTATPNVQATTIMLNVAGSAEPAIELYEED